MFWYQALLSLKKGLFSSALTSKSDVIQADTKKCVRTNVVPECFICNM